MRSECIHIHFRRMCVYVYIFLVRMFMCVYFVLSLPLFDLVQNMKRSFAKTGNGNENEARMCVVKL